MEEKDKADRPLVTNRITKANPPPTYLSGTRASVWIPADPKPIRVPDFPDYYPNTLKLRTHLTMLELVKQYPSQSQMLEFCRAVVAGLTSCFCEAVTAGELRGDLALHRMDDLLESILRWNHDRVFDVDMEQKIHASDEWLAFVKNLLNPAASIKDTPSPKGQERTRRVRSERRLVQAERAKLLNDYKAECREHGIKVTDAKIAQAASRTWNERTPVQRWKRDDPRSTPGADAAIRRVLKERPHLRQR